jgi:hypothetical protein
MLNFAISSPRSLKAASGREGTPQSDGEKEGKESVERKRRMDAAKAGLKFASPGTREKDGAGRGPRIVSAT